MQRIEFQRRCQIKTAANRKNVLFVTPPYHSGVDEIAGRWIPLGLLYLAGAVRQAPLDAEIYDAMAKGHAYPEIELRFRESMADYVATTAITATIAAAVKTLELAKKIKPESVTILGGVHPTFMCEEVFASSAAVDYIVIGEGSYTPVSAGSSGGRRRPRDRRRDRFSAERGDCQDRQAPAYGYY